jgi:predicted DNA-binding protein with PD1-like motif
MKGTEGSIGRVFVVRLEDGDKLPDCIEQFARDNNISTGQAFFIGGIGKGQIVAGPRNTSEMPPDPVYIPLLDAHEVLGIGLLARGENGDITLHMHAAFGRGENVLAGCIRPGIDTWLVGEVIIYEILNTSARRSIDKNSGFELLDVN